MTTFESKTGQHSDIQSLLPWFINGTLADAERREVEQHLGRCLICRREWLDLQRLAGRLQASTNDEVAADASFARLRHQLPPRRATAPAARPWAARRLLWAGIGLAASLTLAFGITLQRSSPTPPAGFETLATPAAAAPSGQLLRVVFADDLPATEIASLLQRIAGASEGSANSVGAQTIRLRDGADRQQALTVLRSHAGVVFAEPVLQP